MSLGSQAFCSRICLNSRTSTGLRIRHIILWTYRIVKVHRDVFGNKINLVSANGKTFTFREPSYILPENGKTVFVYLDTTSLEEDATSPEIGSKIEFTILPEENQKDGHASGADPMPSRELPPR